MNRPLHCAKTWQLAQFHGDKDVYDRELRPALMVQTLYALQEAGVEPDVWKVEGLDRREDYAQVVVAARRGGRDRVSCIVLGRGEDERQVREWLAMAAGVPGFIGFAVGRTTFQDPVVRWRGNTIAREAAVATIAERSRGWVDLFERARRGEWRGASAPYLLCDKELVFADCPIREPGP